MARDIHAWRQSCVAEIHYPFPEGVTALVNAYGFLSGRAVVVNLAGLHGSSYTCKTSCSMGLFLIYLVSVMERGVWGLPQNKGESD